MTKLSTTTASYAIDLSGRIVNRAEITHRNLDAGIDLRVEGWPSYTCSACGAVARIVNGSIVRSCAHTAPVDAAMTAAVVAKGTTR